MQSGIRRQVVSSYGSDRMLFCMLYISNLSAVLGQQLAFLNFMILFFIVTRLAKISLEPKHWCSHITPFLVMLWFWLNEQESQAEGFILISALFFQNQTPSKIKWLLHVSVYAAFLMWLWFVLPPLKIPVRGQFWVIQDSAGYSLSRPFLATSFLILTLASIWSELNTVPPA